VTYEIYHCLTSHAQSEERILLLAVTQKKCYSVMSRSVQLVRFYVPFDT